MVAIVILVGLFALYEITTQRNAIAALTGTVGTVPTAPGPVSAAGAANAPVSSLPTYTFPPATDTGVGAGAQAGIQANVAALNFIPVVGPALSAVAGIIAGGLIQASAKRAAAARNENAAVAAAVPGWDSGVEQVVAAYNAGQIAKADVQNFLMTPQVNDTTVPSGQGLLWSNFWKEVGPQVQVGRNGCQGGTVSQPNNASFCQGSYGAGCCVAYDDLKNSCINMLRALNQAEAHPGTSVSATVVIVMGSKYGGVNRPAYTVAFKKPATQPVATTGQLSL